jgi:hypothetical protein
VLVRGCTVRMDGRRLRVAIGSAGSLEAPKELHLVFGLMAPLLSERELAEEEREEEEAEEEGTRLIEEQQCVGGG